MPSDGHVAVQKSAEISQGALLPSNPYAIAFITCVNDEVQYRTCLRYLDGIQVPQGYAAERIAVFGATSMAEGYQKAMESSTARYKIYFHQDVYLVHRGLLAELLFLFAMYPRLGMVSVIGATQIPPSGKWWEKNQSHCYGRTIHFVRPPQGFPASLFLAPNLRRLELFRLRSFVGDYLPAVALDGLVLATQYDIPWVDPLGGFELYDQVQSLEFVKAGFELGIVRQEAIWCIHWGPFREPSAPRGIRRQSTVDHRAALLRKLYPAFRGVGSGTLRATLGRGRIAGVGYWWTR